jgi:hypothetical protein
MSDLEKFLKSKNISSNLQSSYFKHISKNLNSNTFDTSGLPIDIFSKLLDERIIFLSTEIFFLTVLLFYF